MTAAKGLLVAGALASLSLASAEPGRASERTASLQAAAVPQASVWQHHQAKFNYFGITSLYTCDGLEDKVRLILRYFGARQEGLQVQAQGCPRGPESVSHVAWVSADFDTLAAAEADVPAADTVPARWTPIRINAERPFFMGEGDCELIDQMRATLTKNFSLRGLAYNANCTPHQLSLADFRVQGEALKSLAEHSPP
jgi:hypothetical protein